MGIRYTKVTTDDLAMLAAAVVHARDDATAAQERADAAHANVMSARRHLESAERSLRAATAVFTGLVDHRDGDEDGEG